jgi:hypothetical protein
MKEWEIALPRALTREQLTELAAQLATTVALGKPGKWVIHEPAASDGGTNPHVHVAYLARRPDDLPRPVEQIFGRYNSKDPKLGGWKKEREASGKGGLGMKLKGDRQMLATVINAHLQKSGHSATVDSRSFAERGIARTPGTHLYQSGLRRKKDDA